MPRVKFDIVTDFSEVNRAGDSMQKLSGEAAGLSQDMNTAFRSATKQADAFDKEIKDGTKDIEKMGRTAKAVQPQMADGFRKTGNEVKKANKEIKEMNAGLGDIATGLAAAFSVGAAINFGKKIIDVRAEFQKFEAVLTNTLGSKSLAQSALQMIQEVAAKTPFSVQELTASFVKLANQGFQPTSAEIVKLGDLAASQGKSFDQLTEGIIDAQTGEFERLKEFGIRASKEGNNVKFAFKGVETQVANNSKAIQQYILGLGELEGVAGGMAAISDTLGGKISNLGDNFDAFFNNLGQNSEGVFGSVLDAFNEFLGKANEAQSVLNQTNKILKESGQETGFFEDLFGAQLDLVPLQQGLNIITKVGAEAQKTADFVPAYQALKDKLAEITAQYKEGAVNADQFNRQVALIANAQKALDEQAKALIEKEKKSKEADDAAKAKASKEAFEKTKKQREDLAKELADLQKKATKAEIDQLDDASEEKIKRNKELALQEIDELRKTLIQKGKALDRNFALTGAQEEQIFILRQQAEADANEKILELKKKQADKELAIDKQKITDQATLLKLRIDAQTAAIEKQTSPEGASKSQEVEFERAKQEAILKLKRDAAIESLDIKEKQLQAEADAEIAADPANAEAIRARLEAQKAVLFEETQSLVNDVNESLNELAAGDKQFSLAKLLGLTEDEFDRVKALASQIVGDVLNIFSQNLDAQQELLNQEIEANEKRKEAREDNINDLQSQLEKELELQKQGLANNVDAVNEQIDAAEALRQQDLANQTAIQQEQKKLAKQQFIIDSATQASSILTASANVLKGFSTLPLIGQILGIAAVASMVGSFFLTKTKVLQSTNNQPGFQKGGYTGDLGRAEVAGEVHGQEFVSTADVTKENRELLEGLHKGDNNLIGKGIQRLLENTGVILDTDLPKSIARNRDFIKQRETALIRTDNSGVESRIDTLNKEFLGLKKDLNNKVTFMPDGSKMIQKGSITRIVKKRG